MTNDTMNTESHMSIAEKPAQMIPSGPTAAICREEARESLRIESLCLTEAGIRWGDEWEELLEKSERATPFVWPAAIAAELRQATRPGDLPGRCLGAWKGTSLQGLALLPPKTITRRTALTPFPGSRLKGIRLAGNSVFTHGSPNLLAPIVDAIGDEIRSQKARFLLIEDLEIGSPLHRQIQNLERRGFRWCWETEPQPRFRIEMPETEDLYWANFSSKSRYNLRRQERKMQETALACFENPGEVSDFLELAARISRNSWQQEQIGTRIKNDEHERRFLQAIASKGHWRSFLLLQRGEPVAFLLGICDRNTFYYEEIAYDRKFADYSPGSVLLLKVINHLYRNKPVEWFDFGFGDAPYKRLFGNHQTLSGKGWLLPPGWKSWQLKLTLESYKQARCWSRNILDRIGWLRGMRQRTRRGRGSAEPLPKSGVRE